MRQTTAYQLNVGTQRVASACGQQITEHFTVEEFERSSTADRLGIDNRVPAALLPNLRTLCVEVLEPLRVFAGKPIVISSGYRCPALNRAVGGAPESQHLRGEAADLHLPSIAEGRAWFRWLMDNTTFDQLIWEHDRHGSHWIHVSCRADTERNRNRVVSSLRKG